MTHGCCADKCCNEGTCMALPEGKTCADCRTAAYCSKVLGVKLDSPSCDFYPRRFQALPLTQLRQKHEFRATVEPMLGERVHVRVFRRHPGPAGDVLGVLIMDKAEAEAFQKLLEKEIE